MKNDISQSLGLDLDNINVYAEVYQNIPLSSRDNVIFIFQNLALGKASTDDKCHFAIVSLFSEFKPRQKLNQSQVSFGNLMAYILSISMSMQNFITVFHSVQEIAPLSLFQNLEFCKASTNEKSHFAISWARSCHYQCWRNSLSLSMLTQQFIKIFYSVHEIGLFSLFQNLKLGYASANLKWHLTIPGATSLFQNLALGKASTDAKCHFAIPWARFCQYQCVCKILSKYNPNGLRVKFHCFQNLTLGKTSTNLKCHLTISWATSCQYQCVYKISSQYSTQFKSSRDRATLTFSEFGARQSLDRRKMSFRNLLG